MVVRVETGQVRLGRQRGCWWLILGPVAGGGGYRADEKRDAG